MAGTTHRVPDPADRGVPGWMTSLPADFPVPLVVGAGGGLPGSGAALEAARKQAAEAMSLLRGATVEVYRIKDSSARGTRDRMTVEVTPDAPTLYGPGDVSCMDVWEDRPRGVVYCLAVRSVDAGRAELEPLLSTLRREVRYSEAPPGWMVRPPGSGGGWDFAEGSAIKQIHSSRQLREAEEAAMARLAQGVEVLVGTRKGVLDRPGLWRFAQESVYIARVHFDTLRLVAMWRSVDLDRLYVLVAGRGGRPQ